MCNKDTLSSAIGANAGTQPSALSVVGNGSEFVPLIASLLSAELDGVATVSASQNKITIDAVADAGILEDRWALVTLAVPFNTPVISLNSTKTKYQPVEGGAYVFPTLGRQTASTGLLSTILKNEQLEVRKRTLRDGSTIIPINLPKLSRLDDLDIAFKGFDQPQMNKKKSVHQATIAIGDCYGYVCPPQPTE